MKGVILESWTWPSRSYQRILSPSPVSPSLCCHGHQFVTWRANRHQESIALQPWWTRRVAASKAK